MFRPLRVNESEYGTPQTSKYGQAFRRAVRGRTAPARLGSRGLEPAEGAGLVREQPPVLQSHAMYHDLIGAFAARVAIVRPVVARRPYFGELPLDQQPKIKRVNPWEDPLRGAP